MTATKYNAKQRSKDNPNADQLSPQEDKRNINCKPKQSTIFKGAFTPVIAGQRRVQLIVEIGIQSGGFSDFFIASHTFDGVAIDDPKSLQDGPLQACKVFTEFTVGAPHSHAEGSFNLNVRCVHPTRSYWGKVKHQRATCEPKQSISAQHEADTKPNTRNTVPSGPLCQPPYTNTLPW
jgi:hypothetical protein